MEEGMGETAAQNHLCVMLLECWTLNLTTKIRGFDRRYCLSWNDTDVDTCGKNTKSMTPIFTARLLKNDRRDCNTAIKLLQTKRGCIDAGFTQEMYDASVRGLMSSYACDAG